jgi:hypothetical protein
VESLLAFLAALVALRLAGDLLTGYREMRKPALLAWAGALAAYALASGALAWAAAYGWDDRSFRVYYLFGGLLTAPLLGAGSLLLVGRSVAGPIALVYVGLAIGVAIAAPLTEPVSGTAIPDAQAHLELVPARLVAILGNTVGTLLVVVVAIATMRRRPVANCLLLAGVGVAAAGTAIGGLGEAGMAIFVAIAAVLLYLGALGASNIALSWRRLDPRRARDLPSPTRAGGP